MHANVDVWFFDIGSASSADALGVLSPLEQARAAAFVRPLHRDRYVAAHAGMRAILGQYLQSDPTKIELAYEPHGRPHVANGVLDFNLSHSEDRAALAVATGARVGIDLERERDDVDADALVRQFFADDERARFATLDPRERQRWFYRQWVAKEAVLKAHGGGLSVATSGFAVALDGADAGRVRSAKKDPGEQWHVRMLPAGSGWHAALAADTPADRTRVTIRDLPAAR